MKTRIVKKEISEPNFQKTYFFIQYKKLFFWRTLKEDLIFGVLDKSFDTYQEAESYATAHF